jgi:hypothetical protein
VPGSLVQGAEYLVRRYRLGDSGIVGSHSCDTLYAAVMRSVAVLALVTAVVANAQPGVPQLAVESIGERPDLEARLSRFDAAHLRTIVRLVGLEDPGEPIRVVLVPEDTEAARAAPSWVAGFANGSSSTVVLFPSRSPRYPHDSLEAVLHHELAHVLIHRAARGQPVPRWFDEGLSTVAERAWTFEDRRQLAWALAAGDPIAMRTLDAAFRQGPPEATRAYALASAFVRDIIDRHGIEAPARILDLLAEGKPFDDAFEVTAGVALDDAEAAFFRQITAWERWIPLLTSPFVLWTATTLLALYAIFIARRRRAERRRRWEEQEATESADTPEQNPGLD